MGLSLKERSRRYSAMREMMQAENLDSLLIAGRDSYMSRGNIRYVTDYGIIAGEQYCVFRLEDNPVFIGGKSPASSRLSKSPWSLDIHTTSDPAALIVQELKAVDRGRGVGLVGIGDISVPLYLQVKAKFGQRLVDATHILRKLRLVKSAEEIEKMKIAAGIADKVYLMVKEMVRPGLSGHEIYAAIKKTVFEMGCEYSFEIISTQGLSLNLFHPTAEKLIENGVLALEITPNYEGYYAQLPVTLPAGKFPDRVQKAIPVWNKALQEAVGILRPGVKVSDIYHTVTGEVTAAGYKSPWRPGHAIGLDMIDFWSIGENIDTTLEPGMTLALHPNVLLDPEVEGQGYSGGYTYLITQTGCERFSKVEIMD
ncbi:MAG: aminopeptidase P family protein [Dehalococcoidales bacterium]|nr:aminopeptidase P family protein [Dehalococcoidales bacterium]